MSVTISNIAARQITCDGSGNITWGAWSNSLTDFWSGSFNASTKYVAQLRFRLDKPCSAITLTVRAFETNYSGYVYWKYSTDANDETLARASSSAGVSYDAGSYTQSSYDKKTVTIEGSFPADTDLYLYGFNCPSGSGTWSALHMYALYDSTYFTKVTAAEEIPGTASTLALTGGTLGQPVTVQISRNNAAFTHTVTWSFAGHSGTIATKTADTILSFTPDADTFGAYIPTASSGRLTVSCSTYYDTQQIGTAQTAMLTLSVPSDAAPEVANGWAAVNYTNSGTAAAGLDACIAGYSKAAVSFDSTKVAAKYGTSIARLTAEMGGSSITGSGTIGTVNGTTNTIVVTATDSRGKSTSSALSLSAYAYSAPVLSGVSVFRCDSTGTADDSGAYYSVKANVTYSSAGGQIRCALTAAIKTAGGSYGTAVTLAPGTASILGGTLSDAVTYIVRVRAVDTLGGSTAVEVTIPTAAVAFHIRDGGTGAAFGKYGEADGHLDMAWDIEMNGNKLTGLGAPAAGGDAVPLSYADGHYAKAGYGYGEAAYALNSSAQTEDELAVAVDEAAAGLEDGGTKQVTFALSGYGSFRYFGVIYRRNSTTYTIEGTAFTDARRFIKRCVSGVWNPVEWLCPPMAVGVEYRTTERYDNKSVYAKLLDFGALPSNTYKRIDTGASGATYIYLEVAAYQDGLAYNLPILSNDGIRARAAFTSDRVEIRTTEDMTAFTAMVLIKYTKD